MSAPTEAELEMVAEHGSSPLTQSLAAVQLARRRGRLDELRELIDEPGGGR